MRCRVTDEPYNATCSISITVHGSINRWIVCVGVCLCEFRVDLSMCVWTKISFIFLLFFRLSPFLFFFFIFSVITFSISLYYKSICFHFRYLFLYFYLFPDFSFLLLFFFNINAFVLYFFVFFSWILFCKNDFCVWRSKPLHLFRSVAVGSLQLKLCLSFLYNQSYICMQCYGLIL